ARNTRLAFGSAVLPRSACRFDVFLAIIHLAFYNPNSPGQIFLRRPIWVINLRKSLLALRLLFLGNGYKSLRRSTTISAAVEFGLSNRRCRRAQVSGGNSGPGLRLIALGSGAQQLIGQMEIRAALGKAGEIVQLAGHVDRAADDVTRRKQGSEGLGNGAVVPQP